MKRVSNESKKQSLQIALLTDIGCCLLVMAIVTVHCLTRSVNKLFWYDEVLTSVVLKDASLADVINSLFEPINAMPPLYFVSVWAWTCLFGDSAVAMRTFASLFGGLGWVLAWLMIRPAFGRLTAAAAVSFGLLCSDGVLFFNIDARCYSMYLAAALGTALMFVWSWRELSAAQRWWLGIGSAVFHACLVTVHYVGCIYSGAMVVAAIACKIFRAPAFSLRSYLMGALLGNLVFVVDLPFFLAQRRLGSEDSWLQVPRLHDLYYVFGFENSSGHILAAVLCAAGLVLTIGSALTTPKKWADKKDRSPADPLPAPRLVINHVAPIGVVWLVYLFVPVAIWCESQVGIRLFLSRYMLPLAIR